MLTVSVPGDEARAFLGDLPAEVRLVGWDGLGPRPDGAESVEMFVGRYNAAPPSAEVLADLPQLRVIQLLSAGVEPWLRVVPDGVMLCNGRGVHGASTAELAVAGLLAVVREIPAFLAAQAEHRWERLVADGLDGRHVLVLGAGDIGTRVGAAVRAFGAEVTLVARRARDGIRAIDDLPALLPDHGAVVIALPLTPQTNRMVDKRFLAALPDGAVLVNVARGAIVDTDALLAELTDRRLRAFLDVTDPEPLPADHPLWDAPNLLLTPHVGGGTHGWERRAYELVRAQMLRLLRGEPLVNQVTAGY
ncbi:MAG: 2-hydroxyacid dehydrogenase [Mycobacterium sp.]|nr:2-hydroxyacid dehydrogenase [Mycobacterium sp.]